MYCEEWVDFADTILTQRGGTPEMEKRTTDGRTDHRTPITNLTKLLYLIGREIEAFSFSWGRARGTTRTRRFVGATDVGTGAGLRTGAGLTRQWTMAGSKQQPMH